VTPKNRLTELARAVEAGETIVVARHGRPIFDLVPHQPRKDDPLPEDVLLRPLPITHQKPS
jgi:prevent-host-death family protein